jgi:hypothetical protein
VALPFLMFICYVILELRNLLGFITIRFFLLLESLAYRHEEWRLSRSVVVTGDAASQSDRGYCRFPAIYGQVSTAEQWRRFEQMK